MPIITGMTIFEVVMIIGGIISIIDQLGVYMSGKEYNNKLKEAQQIEKDLNARNITLQQGIERASSLLNSLQNLRYEIDPRIRAKLDPKFKELRTEINDAQKEIADNNTTISQNYQGLRQEGGLEHIIKSGVNIAQDIGSQIENELKSKYNNDLPKFNHKKKGRN